MEDSTPALQKPLSANQANRNPIGGWQLSQDAQGRLVLTDQHGHQHAPVEPVRAFPISDAEHWIALCDEQGRELLVIEDLGALDPSTRAMLEQDLARREFVPVVRRLLSVPADAEPTEWEVETDRGPTRFIVNTNDDVRRTGLHRALVIDSRGIRYLIEDIRKLDTVSRRVIERYLG